MAPRRPTPRAALLAFAGAAGALVLASRLSVGSCFAQGWRSQPAASVRAASALRRRAEPVEMEEPPSDSELMGDSARVDVESRSQTYMRPKREIRGTRMWRNAQEWDQGQRFKPIIEPMLEKGMSVKEITFVLNREPSKYRHLMFRPRQGLPAILEYDVKRMLRNMRHERGWTYMKHARPQNLPPNAPGAPYPWPQKQVYAEVPALEPWTEADRKSEVDTLRWDPLYLEEWKRFFKTGYGYQVRGKVKPVYRLRTTYAKLPPDAPFAQGGLREVEEQEK